MNGKLDTSYLQFTIAADDLPPTIRAQHHPFGSREQDQTTGWPAVLLAVMPLALATSTAIGMMRLSRVEPEFFPGGKGFAWISWSTLLLALWLAGIVYWLIRGLNLAFARGLFAPKRRFQLPSQHIRTRVGEGYDLDIVPDIDQDFEEYLMRRHGSRELLLQRRHSIRRKLMESELKDTEEPNA